MKTSYVVAADDDEKEASPGLDLSRLAQQEQTNMRMNEKNAYGCHALLAEESTILIMRYY
jgi:hypothetical protein